MMPVLRLHFSRELFRSLHLRMGLGSKSCFAEPLQNGSPKKSLLSVFPYACLCTAFLGIHLLVLSHFCMKSKDGKP